MQPLQFGNGKLVSQLVLGKGLHVNKIEINLQNKLIFKISMSLFVTIAYRTVFSTIGTSDKLQRYIKYVISY